CGYKTGPDYIDRAFLEKAAGVPAGNLDMFLQGKQGIFQSLLLSESDYCLVEGVMGLFDGISNTWINSSYDIARQLKIPTLLVYTPKGEMFTAIPKIRGMMEFEEAEIVMIVLNQVSQHYYTMLKEILEENLRIKVLGYIPKCAEFELQSRHLGLIQEQEISDLDQRLDQIAAIVEEHLDLDLLLESCREFALESSRFPQMEKTNVRVAIAKDAAFSFYYRENLKLLNDSCEVTYFSPLKDTEIPECDLLYLGGGYPEVFSQELARNRSMLESIKTFADSGGFIYGECGGFIYLGDRLEDQQMVSVLSGVTNLTPRLQRFGYIDIEISQDCLLGEKGDKIRAHEFHKSTTEISGKSHFNIQKTRGEKTWQCGYAYKNVFAAYPHINFLGNLKAFNYMLEQIQKNAR
ncbi:MAG: cobyrinate a,c-diamide synthase, partial [Proteobacteria bacterium]|nr:cobyrinate a,c-diamide synthase [Pseudomonadota bacterium]